MSEESIQYKELFCLVCQELTSHVFYPDRTTGDEVWSCEVCGTNYDQSASEDVIEQTTNPEGDPI
jgi:hypothetical protein